MKLELIFLEILNRFMHGKEAKSQVYDLDENQWLQLLELARAHQVLPIVYEEASRQKSFQMLPVEIKEQLKKAVWEIVACQARKSAYFAEVYQELGQMGVCPIVMKGIVCRSLYAIPEYRPSGDEDLLIRHEDLEKVDAYLTQKGFIREEEISEAVQEVSYTDKTQGLRLEVHLSLFPENANAYGHFNGLFQQVFQRKTSIQAAGATIYTLDETQHMMYLICHSLKHFLHSGFGIRQLCDMVMFAEHYGEKIKWNELDGMIKEAGIGCFALNLLEIAKKYLGFSAKKACMPKMEEAALATIDCEPLLKDIMQSGIYGKRTMERAHSATITLKAADKTGGKHRGGIVASVFPNIRYMSKKYKYLTKNKWLLPAAWLDRISSYQKEMKGKNLGAPAQIGKERVELLKKYKLI